MRKKFISFLLIAAMLVIGAMPVWGVGQPTYHTYYYNNKKPIRTPAVYLIDQVTNINSYLSKPLVNPIDMCVANQKVYVLDAETGRVIIFDYLLKFVKSIDQPVYSDHTPVVMGHPQGLFVTETGDIYIADTENHRILVIDENGVVKKELGTPKQVDGIKTEADYLPVKLVVDGTGRIYVAARNINMGLLELTSDGEFVTFMGAPRVVPNMIEILWKSISTKAQKEKMVDHVPTEYNNLAITGDGFIYGTINAIDPKELFSSIRSGDDSGRITPIRKLNATGTDILRRLGKTSPVGDVYEDPDKCSRIIDVAVSDYGMYSMLDSEKSRIFTYSEDGINLAVFGGGGNRKDTFQKPVAINQSGDNLLVLDAALHQIFLLKPTVYGNTLLTAVKNQYHGEYDTANRAWQQLLEMSPSFLPAYVGIGKVQLRNEQYQQAMESFERADSPKYYTKAFEQYRKERFGKSFGYIFVGLILLIGTLLLVAWVKKIIRYVRETEDIQ